MSVIGATKSSATRMSCDISDCILADTETASNQPITAVVGDQGHFAFNRNRPLPDEAAGGDFLDAGDDAAPMEDHRI
ncbi:hypothetical protein ACCT09_54395, partial [Rhizobium ruizarguesonis]